MLALIGSPRRVLSHWFKSRLTQALKRSTIRAFELEPAKERDQSISKFLVWRDSVSDIRSANLLGFLKSELGEDEETPAISRVATKR